MKTMKNTLLTLLPVAAVTAGGLGTLAPAPSAGAAMITWGAPATFSGVSTDSSYWKNIELKVPGENAYAYATSKSPATVTDANGVTWTEEDNPANGNTNGTNGNSSYGGFLSGATSGDPVFNGVITHAWDGTPATFGGLTTGQSYKIELFMLDTRTGGESGRTFVATDQSGGTGSGSFIYAYANGGTNSNTLGAYVIGTFTADATTQSLVVNIFSGSTPKGNQLNAAIIAPYSSIPEPATLGLLALGGLGLLIGRRHQTA